MAGPLTALPPRRSEGGTGAGRPRVPRNGRAVVLSAFAPLAALAPLAPLAALAALAACGNQPPPTPPPLDVIWLQRQIEPVLERRTGTFVENLACPVTPPRSGRRIECSAAFNGEAGLIVVTLLDAGPRPRHAARLKNLLLGPLERSVQRRLGEAGFPVVSVDCPGPVPQRRRQVSFCRVEDRAGAGARVRVTQVDDRGTVRLRSSGERPPGRSPDA